MKSKKQECVNRCCPMSKKDLETYRGSEKYKDERRAVNGKRRFDDEMNIIGVLK